ncbi:hypothetical protein DT475_28330, partial [Escherichia coli]|nr:hypothetical protein [Escherichia coli]
QDFYASSQSQKWARDITYLRTDEGWLYLGVVNVATYVCIRDLGTLCYRMSFAKMTDRYTSI